MMNQTSFFVPTSGLLAALALGVLALVGCGRTSLPTPAAEVLPEPGPESTVVHRSQDTSQLAQAEQIFRQHCAACHGERAQGSAGGQGNNRNGQPPSPPLDGTGHAWHHPQSVLHDRIKRGSRAMPAFGDKLTDQEIDDIIAWFQSLWPEEVYRAWSRMDQRRRAQ